MYGNTGFICTYNLYKKLIVSEIHFITSKKGYKLLVYEQYTYARNCKSRKRITWACSSRCSKKCNAQVTLTNEGELVVINKEHSHPPPIFYINEKGEYIRVSEKQLNKIILEKEEIEDDKDSIILIAQEDEEF